MVMKIRVQYQYRIGKGISSITGFKHFVRCLLMRKEKFGDCIKNSGYLLRLTSQKEIAGEHSDKFFKIMLFALFEHEFSIG